jgi:3-dehydroquinate synthase
MEQISLDLDGKKCRILVGHDILGNTGKLILENTTATRFAIITNASVNSLYGKQITQSLEASGLNCDIFEIPDSETSKSLDEARKLYSELAEKNFDRDSCIIGLGGGVVSDLAGFVAATYMRGIGLIHMPTTLLAQVDSAIGGKTGVNIPQGKNLVGAFHQPMLVISDVMTLETLPEQDFRSGCAEIVKYGMAADAEFFSSLEKNAGKVLQKDWKTLEKTVATCSAIKSRIVEQDERDRGKRLVLNYGHTLGHALEAATGYGEFRHGEAIAIGMIFAARVSVQSGLMAAKDLGRLCTLVTAFGLPVHIGKDVETGKLLGFMKTDKKRKGGKTRMVLPTRIGEVVVSDVESAVVLSALEEMRA